ncbi:MAG: DegT/DnrJ/EryC1/StrS family aminotransferase [Candidatus Heimdallarchaeaceae archaeon]
MKINFVNYGKQYKDIKEEVLPEINRVLSSGQLILRKDVEDFEKNFAEYVGTKYAVGVNSGTDALYLSLKVLGIRPMDRVMCPSYTFVATAQVIEQLGAVPVLYSVNEKFLDLKGIKAIMVSHMEGEFGVDVDALKTIVGEIPIIEDACQALGAEMKNKKAGSIGTTGCFSFYPAKLLGCYGDGGAVVTNDKVLYEEIKELRNHYKKDYSKWGINSRLDNLQAAVLNIKLKHFDKILERRNEIAERYFNGLNCLGEQLALPLQREGRVWQDYVVISQERDKLYDFLKEKEIETMKNEYPFPLTKAMLVEEFEKVSLRIPLNETLTNKEVDYVIKNIIKFYGQK